MKNDPIYAKNVLRYMRVYRGRSLREVAQAAGLQPSRLAYYERGQLGLKLSTARKLSRCLGVSLHAQASNRLADVGPLGKPRATRALTAKLEARNRRLSDVGERAQRMDYALERQRLRDTPYARLVNPNFAEDENAGFDMLSFTSDGTPLYVEVKGTTGKADDPFYMTRQELDFAWRCRTDGLAYELHRLYRLSSDTPGRMIISLEELLNDYRCCPETYRVERKTR